MPGRAKTEAELRCRRISWSEEHNWAVQTGTISINNKAFLRQYYEKVFQNFQQTNCRVIAKAYVKLVEPRKQVRYPYNGRKVVAGKTQQFGLEETKPPWWPPGVSHREPDHLPKGSGPSKKTSSFRGIDSADLKIRAHRAPRPYSMRITHQSWNHRAETEKCELFNSTPHFSD